MSVKKRPAEWGAVSGALAFLICALLGVDDTAVLTSLGIVLGFVPAAITTVVDWLDKRRASNEKLHRT